MGHWAVKASLACLILLIAALPLWRHHVLQHRQPEAVFFEFHDVILYTTDLPWWLALGAWLASRQMHRDRARLDWGPVFLWAPLLGLVCLGAAGLASAVDPWYAFHQILRWALLLGLYLMLVNLRIGPAVVVWPMAVGMAVQAAVALPQFAWQRSLGLERWGELHLHPAWPGISVVAAGTERWLRAYGLTQHPNLLGGCMMAFLLPVAGAAMGRTARSRGLLLAAIVLGLAALLATFSRAAWLGLGVGAAAMVGLLAGPWARECVSKAAIRLLVPTLAGVVLAFAVVNWQLLLPRLGLAGQGVEIRSVEERASLSAVAGSLIRDRPLLGVGLGGFAQAMYYLAPEEVGYPVYQPVHNVVLLAAAELGIAGGALWLVLITGPWVAIWRARKRVRLTSWFAGLSGALVGLVVVSTVDAYVWASHQGRLLFWILLGLWASEWKGILQPAANEAEMGA
jgi:hypothetical protein